ncbi:hypothetical protein SIID45300_01748 [Candidatus Magnetaquicoccaceae bacterium FCR-1]|uniref:DUF1320 domain-containing protein n=1 Tax=Candidatus Magnetaquiglobus chichijimensis TaxID=3141448 RepID=A0ABQ0C957_9PROT
MRYLDAQQMIDSYGLEAITDLTDRSDPPRGQIDMDRLVGAIEAAEELAEGYLFPRYTLPLPVAPKNFTAHVRAVAFYNLHRNRACGIADEVRWARDEAEEFFKRAGSGVIALNMQTGQGSQEMGAASTPPPVSFAPPSVFGALLGRF